MDSTVAVYLISGVTLAVLSLLSLLGLRRNAPRTRHWLLPMISAVAVWSAADLVLVYRPDGFGFDSSLRLCGPLLFGLVGGFLFLRLPAGTSRESRIRRDFLWLVAGGGVLGLIVGVGGKDHAEFAVWGAPVGGMPAVVLAFMFATNPFMNMRRVGARVASYLCLCFAAALGLYFVADVYAGVAGRAPLGAPLLVFAFLLVTGATTIMAMLHYRYLNIPIEYVFLRNVYGMDQDLRSFLHEMHALEDGAHNQEELQEKLLEVILQRVSVFMPVVRAMLISVDAGRRLVIRSLGESETLRPNESVFARRLFGLRLNQELADELRQVFLLEPGVALPLARRGSKYRFGRVARSLRQWARRMQKGRYELFVPLLYQDSIWGLLLLGRKVNDEPHWNGERRLLGAVTASFAAALRSNVLGPEVQRLADSLPADESASAAAERPVVRIKLPRAVLLYRSHAMEVVVARAKQVAPSALPVLITGETGTGKELIANLLHVEGRGARLPFVAVNSAAIPGTLWESEVFGHKRGSFTGATQDSPGLVGQAADGTLFLDEIGEMPLEIQAKILRLIQERLYRPVGERQDREARCRLVFATHRDLGQLVRTGGFREDLFYRIHVHALSIPPLRERTIDIRPYVESLLERHGNEPGVRATSIAPEALAQLELHDWPGNVRELENTVLRLMLESVHVITAPDVREALPGSARPATAARRPPKAVKPGLPSFDAAVNKQEEELISQALAETHGNISDAARRLAMSRGKLLHKIRELGLQSVVERSRAPRKSVRKR